MSLIASSLKGKAVQRISCSLCNAGPAGYRALSSSSSRAAESDISPAERQRRRELANRILQEEALENQRQAGSASGSNLQSGLSELTSTFRGIASEGIRAGSIAQRTQTADLKRQPLNNGRALNPGDLRKQRMWPEPQNRQITAMDAMGPNRKKALKTDYFLNLPVADGKGINPMNEYLNPELLSRFVTNMGKIMSRSQTQLTWKNQRRLGKAIRRARAMGLMPYFGDWSHPSVKEAKSQKWGMAKTGTDASGMFARTPFSS